MLRTYQARLKTAQEYCVGRELQQSSFPLGLQDQSGPYVILVAAFCVQILRNAIFVALGYGLKNYPQTTFIMLCSQFEICVLKSFIRNYV